MITVERAMYEYKKATYQYHDAIRAGRLDKAIEFHKKQLALMRLMDILILQEKPKKR